MAVGAVDERNAQEPESEVRLAARGRGRPRNVTTDEKILSAARSLLKERGFDAMSFEAIAQRAGVTRPAIYRRWPSKAHLVSEIAVRGPGLPEALSSPDIGQSLQSWLEVMVERYGRPEMKAALGGLVSTYQTAPELRMELEGSIEAGARKQFDHVIRTNQADGYLRSAIAPDTLFDIIVGAVFYRSLGSSFSPSPDFVQEVFEIIMRGIAVREDERAIGAPGDDDRDSTSGSSGL